VSLSLQGVGCLWVEGVRGAWEVCPNAPCWFHRYATGLKGSSGQRGRMCMDRVGDGHAAGRQCGGGRRAPPALEGGVQHGST
jgi:hypothetical protein